VKHCNLVIKASISYSKGDLVVPCNDQLGGYSIAAAPLNDSAKRDVPTPTDYIQSFPPDSVAYTEIFDKVRIHALYCPRPMTA